MVAYPGLTAGVYLGCNNTNDVTGRTIIYLSGFDLMDFIPSLDRTPGVIFSTMIQQDQISQLRNNGYNFMVVDWDNSRIDLRFNALYLVNMIEQLKKAAIENGNSEQFVIMGESMGGVIGRYALTYMESDEYQNHSVERFFVDELDVNNTGYLATHPTIYTLPSEYISEELMHNSRLLITLDAPHQGANIPISIQKAYDAVFNTFVPFLDMGLQATSGALNLFLNGQAAQQMLLYHIDTEGGGQYKTYTRHPDGEAFYSDLQREGNGYPQHCKVVLMSNGALNGERQTNIYSDEERVPNDRIIDFHTELYCRFLWIKVPIFGGDLTLRTNPQGDGEVLHANAGHYWVRIKLKWFGIRITTGYNSILDKTDYAHTIPFCTASGGRLGENLVSNIPTEPDPFPNNFLFNLFGHNIINDGNGCITFESHAGPNGFSSTNLDFEFCTDGIPFNFVPVQSALDYGLLASDPDLDFDIEHDNTINERLASVPAAVDVIIGYPGPQGGGTGNNHAHVGFRNDAIRNLTGLNAMAPQPITGWESDFPNTYHSCISETGQYDTVRRGFLNLEIGDEELYLENNELDWNATYVVEYDLHVNDRNPHYEYPNFVNFNFRLPGMYSKEEDFVIDNGNANFVFDAANSPTAIGFNFTNQGGSWTETDQPMNVCCHNYWDDPLNRQAGKANTIITVNKNRSESYISVYPNPNNGSKAILKYKLKQPGKASLEIFNLSGQRLMISHLPKQLSGKEFFTAIDLAKLRISKGMYFIRLYNGKEVLHTKLIVSN